MDLGDAGGEEEALFEDGKFVEAFEVEAAAGEEGDAVTLGGVASALGCVKVFGPVGEAEEAEGLLGDAGAGLGVELEDGGEAGIFADPGGGDGPAPVAVAVRDGGVISTDFDEEGREFS